MSGGRRRRRTTRGPCAMISFPSLRNGRNKSINNLRYGFILTLPSAMLQFHAMKSQNTVATSSFADIHIPAMRSQLTSLVFW
jgi:hypothetical protein